MIGPIALLLRPDALARLARRSSRHATASTAGSARQCSSSPGAARRRRGRAPGSRAGELARRRPELARVDARDAGGQLGLELRDLGERERRRDDGVGPLEEVVDDLDLLGAGAEARERVDEALQPVVRLDDLLRRRLADQVRLVVEDERARPVEVQHVEEAVQEHAVVLEREVPLLVDARQRRDAARELGVAVRRDVTRECARAPRRSRSDTRRAPARDRAAQARAGRPARAGGAPRRRSRSRAGRRRRRRPRARARRSFMPET